MSLQGSLLVWPLHGISAGLGVFFWVCGGGFSLLFCFSFPLADVVLFNTDPEFGFILNDSSLLNSLNRGALLFN